MKHRIIEVTLKQQFIIPMIDDYRDVPVGTLRTRINGWTIDEVIDDWFKHHDINQGHATRDGHTIGNSKKIEDIEVLGAIED